MKDTIRKWEQERGVTFLNKIGVKAGQTVLDFGARVGHYSIPAAIAVGNTGLIYAVDKEQNDLEKLRRKAKSLNLRNIKPIRTTGVVMLDFKKESIDIVLLYDVLHYLKPFEREILYGEIYRILRKNGFLSVYPKHVVEDSPLNEFKQLHVDDIKMEIIDSNFKFKGRYCEALSHDDSLNYGCVYNFTKSF